MSPPPPSASATVSYPFSEHFVVQVFSDAAVDGGDE